jgi:hypothetical protein
MNVIDDLARRAARAEPVPDQIAGAIGHESRKRA